MRSRCPMPSVPGNRRVKQRTPLLAALAMLTVSEFGVASFDV